MPLSADRMIDRKRLKSELARWRALAVGALVLCALIAVDKVVDSPKKASPYIARYNIEGVIFENPEHLRKLKALKDNKNIKAVIVYINSPGGTIVGGETLYETLRQVAQEKPTVAVMGSLATSGGYMAALATDYIIAHKTTVTGSIGVMLHSAEFTELSEKIGVEFNLFKSGDLKGTPSPMEKLSPKAAQVLQETINDGYQVFVDMVAERRNMETQTALTLADGRIYTGRQAQHNGLIDALGSEDQAVQWLSTAHNIDSKLPVKDVLKESDKTLLEKLMSTMVGDETRQAVALFGQNGMLAFWSPTTSLK